MKERPILFSAPMIRALFDGSKTQTRRVLSKLPSGMEEGGEIDLCHFTGTWCAYKGGCMCSGGVRCPYGVPGDRLWVREEHYRFGHWEPVPGVKTKTGRMKWRFVADTNQIRFDAPESFRKGRHHRDPAAPAWHKRLARFMPRAASRITLEVTDVRVQRVQEISEQDGRAEGVLAAPFCKAGRAVGLEHVEAFENLWDSINGKREGCSWEANPWTWAITFKRLAP